MVLWLSINWRQCIFSVHKKIEIQFCASTVGHRIDDLTTVVMEDVICWDQTRSSPEDTCQSSGGRTLKIEAEDSSETLINVYRTTRRRKTVVNK